MLEDQRWLRRTVHWLAVLVVAGAFVAGALGGAAPRVVLAQDDTLEANKALIASLYDEIVNNQNYEVVLDAVAPGMIEHTRDGDIVHETPEDYRAALTEEMAQYPGLGVTIDYQIAENDLVANRVTVTLMDGQVSTRGISIFRIADGKVVEMEEILDEVAIANQMSMMPGMAEEGMRQEGAMAGEVLAEGFNGPMGILRRSISLICVPMRSPHYRQQISWRLARRQVLRTSGYSTTPISTQLLRHAPISQLRSGAAYWLGPTSIAKVTVSGLLRVCRLIDCIVDCMKVDFGLRTT